MHWNPEHAQPLSQWPEQHLDVSSTTSSPAHKPEQYPGRGRGSYSYAWANDDISALTASNLLKRYAEKYSSVLDSAYERPAMANYLEPGAFGPLNGSQKNELEPWPLTHSTESAYPLVPPSSHDGLKAIPPGSGSVSAGSSNLSDSGYSASSSCSGPHSSDYPPSYSGTYLSSGYCPQGSSALPSAPLHALQSGSTLLPSYSPSTPVYNYPPTTYPHQTSLPPTYNHTSTPYLPSGIATPTPVPTRPAVVGGTYTYQNSTVASESTNSLKRKAFEMSPEGEPGDGGSRYRKYTYDATLKSGADSPYSLSEKAECRGSAFATNSAEAFKPSKAGSQAGIGADDVGKYNGLKPLLSPAYGAAGDYSPPGAMTGDNRGSDHGFPQQQRSLKHSENLKNGEQRLLELVNNELQDCTMLPLWSELVGHTHLKAALEEEFLWPALRPDGALRPPRTVLLFGPRGGGKTTLAHSMANQLGATFFKLSCMALTSKWKSEAEPLLAMLFSVALARQPAVVMLSELEALEDDENLTQQLQSALEKALRGTVLVVGSTRHLELLKEPLLRLMAKRYHVSLPDMPGRRQLLVQVLGQHGCSLSEQELAAVIQRTEGFSTRELLQLGQQAVASASGTGQILGNPLSTPGFKDFENAFCKVRPHSAPKEQDTCMEWSKVYSH